MSGKYWIDWDSSNKRWVRREGIATSSGSADGEKIAITDASTGKFHSSLIPDVNAPTETITASANIADKSLVHIHYSTGRKVRPALATDGTKPAMGYVETGVLSAADATVVLRGIIVLAVGSTGVTTANIDDPVFLDASTAGLVTLTPPSTTGNVIQWLGRIIDVDPGVSFRVDFDPQIPIEI